MFSDKLETLVRATEQMLSSPLGSAGSLDSYEHEPVDSTQNFCEELNKRQIMPMELMQARSHHRFNEAADRVFTELQQVRMAVRKTAMYVKERQAEIGKLHFSLYI